MPLDPLTRHALEVSALRPDAPPSTLLADALERQAAYLATHGICAPPPTNEQAARRLATELEQPCPCGSRELDEECRCARCGAEGGGA